MVERRKREGSVKADSVAVLTLVRRAGHTPAIVLIKQFRPPLKTYTIELPAGVMELHYYCCTWVFVYHSVWLLL